MITLLPFSLLQPCPCCTGGGSPGLSPVSFSWKQFLQSNAQILFLSTINDNSWVEVSFVSSRDSCEQDQQTEQSMATTSNILMTSPGMFIPSVSVTSFSPPSSIDNFFQTRRRSRCISCSDSSIGSSFEDSSFLLENTLIPRRSRTSSISERIKSETQNGTVTYFCRSRGHGFLRDDHGEEHFVHVSDIESDFVPMKGDKVSYRLCPIPPKFERSQAVNVQITQMSPSTHKRWDSPQTPEDLQLDEHGSHPPPADV